MKRRAMAGMAALALAGGMTVATAIPSQADSTVTVTSSCKFVALTTPASQTGAQNVNCSGIQAAITYRDAGAQTTLYTKLGTKVTAASAISLVDCPTTMPVGHFVNVWLPDGGTAKVTL